MPEEGVNLKDFMKAKYGTVDTDELRKKSEPLKKAGESVGITWNKERKMVNTVSSHCLVELAHAQGKGDAMVSEVFRAYFEDGDDIGDKGVLCSLAARVGVEGAAACLAGGAVRQAVSVAHNAAITSGVTSVPHFTIRAGSAEPVRFAGAQSQEFFSHVISRLMHVAGCPSGTRVRLLGGQGQTEPVQGDVVSIESDHFAVKLVDGAATSAAGGSGGLVRAPRDRLEVLRAIPPGSEVELAGLSVAELNGRKGEVVRYHGEKGRFEVRLFGEASGATKALRGDNLQIVRTFSPGDEMVLGGLKTESLNGQRGEVLGYLAEKGRFEVRLRASGEVKAIQGENLQAPPQ
mmetsp:Transcript_98368/g.219668  ORF Transcript_98368/g.219668 Transcript_98368/m.219668 type:complete len:347 (+) Transcript_98368:302-1342(+)